MKRAMTLIAAIMVAALVSVPSSASAGVTHQTCEAAGYRTTVDNYNVTYNGETIGIVRTLKKSKSSFSLCTYVIRKGSFRGYRGQTDLYVSTNYGGKGSGNIKNEVSYYSDGITYTVDKQKGNRVSMHGWLDKGSKYKYWERRLA